LVEFFDPSIFTIAILISIYIFYHKNGDLWQKKKSEYGLNPTLKQ